jgi:hypothetical protein
MIARFAHQGEWTEEDWDRAFKRNKPLRWEDYEWMLANCKECDEVGANVNTSTNLKYDERELFGTNIVGVTASMGQIENKTISEGRFIAAHEVEHAALVCVIGGDVREQFFLGEGSDRQNPEDSQRADGDYRRSSKSEDPPSASPLTITSTFRSPHSASSSAVNATFKSMGKRQPQMRCTRSSMTRAQ